jgi:hypothetical protein
MAIKASPLVETVMLECPLCWIELPVVVKGFPIHGQPVMWIPEPNEITAHMDDHAQELGERAAKLAKAQRESKPIWTRAYVSISAKGGSTADQFYTVERCPECAEATGSWSYQARGSGIYTIVDEPCEDHR